MMIDKLGLFIKSHPAFLDHADPSNASLFDSPGYELPSAAGLIEISVSSDTLSKLAEHNIELRGALGTSNRIIFDPSSTRHKAIVQFNNFSGNTLVLASGCYAEAEILFEGREHLVVLCASDRLSSLRIVLRADRSALFYGRDCSAGRVEFFIEGPEKCIICGADCMFSAGIPIRTSDGHAIFRLDSKEIVNLRKNVLIEPHVWIGENVIVLKGAAIGRGSIIGARSIVSGRINPFSSAIGVPAREIQSGVSWTRQGRPTESDIDAAIRNSYAPIE